MQQHALSRRTFLELCGISASVAALAACAVPEAGPSGGESETMEPMTVTFAAWAGNTDIPAWEELERTYVEQNPKR